MIASSVAVGTRLASQLLGVSQSPPAALVQVTVEGSARSSRRSTNNWCAVFLLPEARKRFRWCWAHWVPGFRKRSNECNDMVRDLLFGGGLRYNANAIAVGAQTERRSDAAAGECFAWR